MGTFCTLSRRWCNNVKKLSGGPLSTCWCALVLRLEDCKKFKKKNVKKDGKKQLKKKRPREKGPKEILVEEFIFIQ